MDFINADNKNEVTLNSCIKLRKELLSKLEISTEFDKALIAKLDNLLSDFYALGISGRVNMEIIYESEYEYVKSLSLMNEDTDLITFRYVNFNLSENLEEAAEIYREIRQSFDNGRAMYSSFLINLINMPYSLIGEVRPRILSNLTYLTDSYLSDGILNKNSAFIKELMNLITFYFSSNRDLSDISYKDYSILSQRIRRFSSPKKILSREEYEKYHKIVETAINNDLNTLRKRENR